MRGSGNISLKKKKKIATCSFYIAIARGEGTRETEKVNKRTPTQVAKGE